MTWAACLPAEREQPPQRLRPAHPMEMGFQPERLERLDRVVERAIAQGQAPGAVLLVGRRGRIVYRKAFGHRSLVPEKEPMTVDTIFDMASLTKVMATATALMILVEEGRLALSDRVADYFPEFGRKGKEEITLLQLATHFSGLRPDVDLEEPWEGYEKALELACEEEPVAAPGERFIYSDINYFVLGEVIRRVSGQHLHEFSRERIFLPLGMKDTGFLPEPAKRSRIAPTEYREGELLRGKVHDPTASRMGGCAGHAGLFSTADDTAAFAQMILNGGRYNGTVLLSPLGVRAMITPQSPAFAPQRRGIGFDISSPYATVRGDLFPLGSVGHTGFTGTSLWLDPNSGVFVVLLTSRLHPHGKGNVVGLRKKVSSVTAAALEEALHLPQPDGF